MGKLTFDKSGHRYFYNEIQVPSVSRILGEIDFSNKPQKVIDMIMYAGDRGTRTHNYIESINRDYVRLEPDQDIVPYIDSFTRFSELYDYKSLKSETPMCSVENSSISEELKDYPFAGTIDDICMIDGIKSIIDFKTNSKLQKRHKMQVGAYMLLSGIDKGYLLHLQDGNYNLFEVKPKYKDMFIEKLREYYDL